MVDLRPLRERLRSPTRLERRLRGWLLGLALVPVLLLLAAGTWLGLGSIDWVGTLGPWDRVAESSRELFEAADRAEPLDAGLERALERHRRELSSSLVLARRWQFLGERVSELLPALALALAAVLALAAIAVSRRLAADLARPIHELVDWAGRLAREEALPEPTRAEAGEVREVQVLRGALRAASSELAVAKRRALEAERVRIWGEMARRVAHEMKNPLTPLRLATSRLSAQAPPQAAESLRVLEEETARLEELARAFASLGRPPAGPVSEIDVGELLDTLLRHDAPPAVERSLEVAPELPLVEGHYEELVRALRNLVRNAVEATDGVAGPRRIGVSVGSAGEAAGWVEIRIEDNGPGIPTELRERIFEPDFTTKSHGTGLGLALARQTVEAHGGTLRAEARAAGGARMIVRLPVRRARVVA